MLVAVGAAPNVRTWRGRGSPLDNGIVVDAALRTSDPNIFAAGDVANAFHPFFDRQIRVEHWANARQQPKAAASSMLGKDVSYDELPYFFTDQYDLGMEYVGYVEPAATTASFSAATSPAASSSRSGSRTTALSRA